MIGFKGGLRSASGIRTGLGKDFVALVVYLCSGSRDLPDPNRVAWISYRNLDGIAEPVRAAQLMRACASQHPRVEKPVYHFGLSLPPAEHLRREQWNQAVDRTLRRLGLANHQALVVAHRDTECEHVHVALNRIGDDGRAWKVGYDNVKVTAVTRRLGMEFGLARGDPRNLPVQEDASSADRLAVGAGQRPLKYRVRYQASTDLAEATDWSDLEARLAGRGFRLTAATRHAGLLITDGSRFAALSRVDQAISGPKLAQRFGETFEDHRQAHPDPPALQEPGRNGASPPGVTLENRAAELLDGLTRTRATFAEADLHRAACYQPDSIEIVRAALRSDRILDLGVGADGAGRYTTRDYLDAEARLLAAAAGLASRDRFRLDPADQAEVAAADRDRAPRAEPLAAGHGRAAPVEAPAAGDDLAGQPAAAGLSAEQRAAVVHATAAADLAQIVGDMDGRSAAAAAIAAAYRERGYEVHGAAPTVHAAATLESATGVPSRTLADLERSWSASAGRLDARSVLLLDEAGTLDVRRLGGILAEAEERGAKVVLLGDPGRMQAIGAGDALRGLLEQHPSVRLDAPRCQREPWQAAASEQLAAGRVAAALDRYEAAGRLHWAAGRAAAREELLRAHVGDGRQDPAATRLIVAPDGAEAALLNAAVRAERLTAGELGPAVRAGRIDLACGDRIVFWRDDRQGRAIAGLDASPVHGVRRGSLGTVVGAERRRVEVRLDDGRRVAFDPVRYRSVGHGYAVTIAQSRAAAADRVYVLADPRMHRDDAVVALSRHRDTLDVYADRASFPGRDLLDRTLSHPGRRDLAGDYAAADLRRAVDRLQDAAAAIASATRVERPFREALAAHEALQRARQRVVEARRSLSQPTDQLYAEPAMALRALLRDPAAPARLREGAARDYGALRGRALFGRADRERAQALHAVPTLTGRLDAYQRSLAGLQAAKRQARASLERIAGPSLSPKPSAGAAERGLPGAAAAPAQAATPPRLPPLAQVRRELARVDADLRGHHQASRTAQDAVEMAIRALGRPAVDSALVLLPPEVALPVNLAVRAVERALERGPVLGLGR
ncbi:MAG TPA: AAA family ATPase [Thermoanaerobaculia bacterium]|nr:AAA family ATPase [Thermoanaerobaculia bacterium]